MAPRQIKPIITSTNLAKIIGNFLNSFNRRTAGWLGFAAWLTCASPVFAALVVSTSNQTGPVPFTPAWTPAADSLIAGFSPSSSAGDFSEEPQGGSRDVNSLTAGGDLTIDSVGSPDTTCSPNYVTGGNGGGAGSSLIYPLPASANGYNLTNITVYGGWQDNGRDAQAYTVSYSTVINPAAFTVLTPVSYNPSVAGGVASANRVVLDDSAGGIIAANVAAVKFDFTSPGSENGYVGYGAITVEGVAATNLIVPPIVITTANQNSESSFTPAWAVESDSLIAGQLPSAVGSGNFTYEPGVAGLGALTDGTFGAADDKSSYATCGGAAGQSVTYFLNGATITNIVVYSGWPDQNRDGQFYTVFYSTVAAPTSFVPLTSVYDNPDVTGVSANRVAIASPTGMPLATNVAFLKFDFSAQDGGTDNGYSGYAEIIVEGTNGVSAPLPPTAMNTSFPAGSAHGADAALVFNEIMYHPATNEAGTEWIEFYNQLAVDLDISNWRVSGDTDYTFPSGTRVAGRSYIVLARDPAQLAATGLSSNVFGPFSGALNNSGGTLNLYNNSGRLMDTVTFGTEGGWPVTPDGAGPSLAKKDRDWGSYAAANWTASSQNGGTPGVDNFATPAAPVTVAFNELSGTTNAAFWVELMNYGTNAVSLGNCRLHHVGATNTDYQFPPGATLAPGAFLVLSNDTLGFISPDSGDKLFLFATNETAVYDGVVLKKRPQARSPDGTGPWLVPNQPTPGASNRFAFHPELVINEIMYHHKDFPAANTNSVPQKNPEEWIELYNRSSNMVDLTGWTLAGGISYAFGADQTIAPGGYLVVARDADALYAAYPAIDIVGNFSGHLGSDDEIILNDPRGNPANVVHYYDDGRWPEAADGGGSSLELRDSKADNSKAEAWAASNESGKSAWQTFTYRMVAQPSATPAPDSQWHDFVMGLLTDGECYVDDISVIQSPTNNPVQLIANGNFENGAAGWRFVGNHQRSVVETDPDNAGNHVLHVVASGPQEHMNNHIETTLANGASVANGVMYEISYRARWLSGDNLLNTRLYFNRVAQTTALAYPQLNGTPGAANSAYAGNIGPTFAQFQNQPVVPQAGQPVTVFVRAQDTQGVAACTVWWSVNGGAWSSALMTLTNGAYAGTIPGQPTGRLVQFYVSATDALGAVSTFPAKGANSGAFYRVNDGAANVAAAHSLRILMSPANVSLQSATTNLMSNENLPCTVVYDERQVYYDMAVRLKSSERGRVEAARIGFHLQFNPDELFRGVHPVMILDRSAGGDRPAQEEMVVKHMAGHAGLPEVNSDLCRVIAPQSAENGWAILSPRFEDNFAGTTFTNGGDGTLYEMELAYYPLTADANGYKLPAPDNVQGADISDLGNDKESYRYNFIIKNHRNEDDYSAFINFAKSWSLNGAALDTQTRQTTDVDEWLGVYALVSLCGVGDMYTFGNNHNLMTYLRPADGKVLYFPWDMDFAFSQSPTAPLVGDQNFSKIVNLPGNLRRFYAHILDDINTTYNVAYMAPWISHYESFPGQDWSGDLNYISQRGSYAANVINNAGGSTPFSVNPSAVANNLVTLSGTAPVQIASVLINGVNYPVTWTSISSWTVQVPVSSPTNILDIQGYDLQGDLITNATRTVVWNETAPDPSTAIVFNEIMYDPAVTNAEYVELFNTSASYSFDLSGWRVNGLGYTFPPGSILAADNFLVLAKDRVAFATTYGNTLPVFDQFTGNLDLNGETLTLFRPDPAQTNQELMVNRVRYETVAPWPMITNGAALQLIDSAQDNSRVANWTAVATNASFTPQFQATATPDAKNSVAATLPVFPSVWLNEAQAENLTGPTNNAGANVPWVELYNPGTNALSLAGFYLANNYTNLTQWAFPANSSVLPNQFLVIWCDGQTNQSTIHAPHASFSPTPGSGKVVLARLINGNTPQIVDYLNYTNLPANWSYGDFPDGQPFYRQNMFAVTPSTFNTNSSPPITIAVNEWMADNSHTLANPAGGKFDDWFELYNYGTNTVDLGGYYLTGTLTDKTKFLIPDTHQYLVPSKGFFLVWADNGSGSSSTNRPELHVNFKLSKSGDSIGLFAPDGATIDALSFGVQTADVSEGRFPDGVANIFSMPMPTPQTKNVVPNTAPVLAAIHDIYVHVGQTVQFTATATDADSSYQTLTFSLSNAPAGASINPTTGIFSWTTANGVAPGTNAITVRVSNNGTPPLSDARAFSIFISGPPQFTGVKPAADGQVQISFGTLPGQQYQVQFKNSLTDSTWTSLGGIIPGTGSPVSVADDMTGHPQRFYRLLALP